MAQPDLEIAKPFCFVLFRLIKLYLIGARVEGNQQIQLPGAEKRLKVNNLIEKQKIKVQLRLHKLTVHSKVIRMNSLTAQLRSDHEKLIWLVVRLFILLFATRKVS